jgi:hypothetical protein
MDTSFWKQLHPDIQVQAAKQKLFKKYPYKMVLRCNGAAMLRSPETPFDEQIQYRKQINYGGSWRTRPALQPSSLELDFLHVLKDIKLDLAEQNNEDIKMRIEDPNIQFYAVDQNLLKDLAKLLFANQEFKSFLQSITVPRSDDDLNKIMQGYVLRKSTQYACKINIRDGRYNHQIRQSLLNYIDSLNEDATIPTSVRKSLEKANGDYVWDAYFYCNDPNIQLMIQMINPRLIRSVDLYHCDDK